jgi:hypothetical protein
MAVNITSSLFFLPFTAVMAYIKNGKLVEKPLLRSVQDWAISLYLAVILFFQTLFAVRSPPFSLNRTDTAFYSLRRTTRWRHPIHCRRGGTRTSLGGSTEDVVVGEED